MKKGDPKPVKPSPKSNRDGSFDQKKYTLEYFDYLNDKDEEERVVSLERKRAEMRQKAKRRL